MTTVWLPALFGALFQELLRWMPLLNRPPSAAEKKRLRSGFYWIPALLLVLGGTIGTYYFTLDGPSRPLQCIALGAAFPTLFKKVVDAFVGIAEGPHPIAGGDRASRLGPTSAGLEVLRGFFG